MINADTYILPYTHTFFYIHPHKYITYIHKHIHTYIHAYIICKHIPTNIPIYIHACIHACIHAYIHPCSMLKHGPTDRRADMQADMHAYMIS